MTTMQPPAAEPASPRRPLTAALHWMAGAPHGELLHLGEQVALQYAALGWVFTLNLVVLCAAWIKVGTTYFGWLGALVPGLAVPTLFVVGLDRLVAMRRRPLTGELAGFNPPWREAPTLEPKLRVAMALALSTLTTLTFMMAQSQDPIAARQREDSRLANQALRKELTDRIQHTFASSADKNREHVLQIQNERILLQGLLEALTKDLRQVDERARNALDGAAAEAGGLDHRQEGMGPRYRAQMQMSQQNAQAAEAIRVQMAPLQARLDTSAKALAELSTEAKAALAQRNASLAQLDEMMRKDERYVPARRGLFADATAFVQLFADPQQAAGMWLMAIPTAAVLFVLECAALLAVAINPCSPLDVLRMARNREISAAVVATSEVKVARSRATSPSIQVEEFAATQPAARMHNAEPR
jgi:hypothetical protein